MIKGFFKRICEKLMASEFSIASVIGQADTLSKDTGAIVLWKNESPVLYVVSLVNLKKVSLERYESSINAFLEQVSAELNDYRCQNLVCINLLTASEPTDSLMNFINEKEIIPGSKTLNVWWLADTKKEIVIAAKGHPDKILNIRSIVDNSFGAEAEEERISLSKLQKDVKASAALKRKSNSNIMTRFLLLSNILIFVFMAMTRRDSEFVYVFGNHFARVLEYHEYYRLITSMFVHAGIAHLTFNSLSIFIFGIRAENYYGSTIFTIMYFLSGIMGGLISDLFSQSFSVGASGGIYGIIGGVLALTWVKKRSVEGLSRFTLLILIISGLALGFMDPSVDNYAHIGGIITGFLLGVLYLKITEKEAKTE